MNPAAAAVHSFRFDSPTAHTSLREEPRANETVCDDHQSPLEPLQHLVRPLTAAQMQALNLLAMGKSVVSVPKTLGIGVSTLHRWKATHPLFRAELAQRQHNLFDAMVNKLRMTMSKAVDELFALMTSDNAFKRKEVMFEMLKLLKPQKFLVPGEPRNVEGVLDETVRERRASRGESASDEITEEERIAAIPAEWRVKDYERPASSGDCHAERSEASSEMLARDAQSSEHPSNPELRTALPSREGSGERAARDSEVATHDPCSKFASKRDKSPQSHPDRPRAAQSSAPRPHPHPHPQGEGSLKPPEATCSIPQPLPDGDSIG